MATLTCEFEMVRGDGRCVCYAFGLGAGTERFDYADARDMCVDCVCTDAQDLLMRDEPILTLPLDNEPRIHRCGVDRYLFGRRASHVRF